MSYTFQSAWWEIDLPTDWLEEQDESCSTFFAEDGVGALQVSAYRKDEDVTDLDLEEFAEEHIPAAANKLLPVHIGSLTGFYFQADTKDEYCLREWWLRSGETMI
ncbi:MAG TPA: hypothetical protein VF719_02470, partial [Abditibacteriaceae bacterium]